ncbi:hypothetical protein [Enterobacter kobei]|uniref:hypothetical protein n=1 Tax=Enterobacter kobei TaxID=208224 RepID=UPI00388F467B
MAKHDSKISAAKTLLHRLQVVSLLLKSVRKQLQGQSGPMVSDDTAMQGAFASNDNASTNQFSGDGLSGSQPDTGNGSESHRLHKADEYEQFKNKQNF